MYFIYTGGRVLNDHIDPLIDPITNRKKVSFLMRQVWQTPRKY